MRKIFYLLIAILIFLFLFNKKLLGGSDFEYDPSVPYPIFNPGDFWPDKFDERGLQNAILYRDRIYCNTIDVCGDSNFLYCLNPVNGHVEWRAPVEAYAAHPVSFQNDTIIYFSYLGDISTFSNKGKTIWKTKLENYGSYHWLDTIHSKLMVKAVYYDYVYVYDIKSGKLITRDGYESLEKMKRTKIKKPEYMQNKNYRFSENGIAYLIKCWVDEKKEYHIEISK